NWPWSLDDIRIANMKGSDYKINEVIYIVFERWFAQTNVISNKLSLGNSVIGMDEALE
ncbi:14778_t:CDS:1, partial [Gigaspora rosea]